MPLTSVRQLEKSLFLILLVGLSMFCAAQNPANTWKIRAPYPDNPLKQGTLSGSAGYDGQTTAVELQMECRPDADGPRVNLLFLPKALKFDADPFEGPGGLGERRKLRVTLGRGAWSHHFSGYYVESDRFVFSFALTSVEAQTIAAASSQSQSLTIAVDPAKQGAPIRFIFQLPADSAPVRSMVTPCLSSFHKS